MDSIDEIDNQLIKLLGQNAWQRAGALAEVLSISPATVRGRLRRLIQNGVVRAVAIADSSTITRGRSY
ncbi:winged helix-turn-helix transcriptional regulator [Chloroflexota bacterium]